PSTDARSFRVGVGLPHHHILDGFGIDPGSSDGLFDDGAREGGSGKVLQGAAETSDWRAYGCNECSSSHDSISSEVFSSWALGHSPSRATSWLAMTLRWI